jgi:biopolymer transport protein ExbD
MPRFRDTGSEGNEGSIDMSPMIDCVFILLIFFIVTTTFVEESGLDVDKPQPASTVQLEENESCVLLITEKGQIVCEGREIGLGGVATQVKKMASSDERPVVIQSAAGVTIGILTRVIDEARVAGATKISLAAARGAK